MPMAQRRWGEAGMRTVVRVGLITGVVGGGALYGLQRFVAVGVVLGIVAVGIVAGLGTAKWLEWPWYGRQLQAGLRAGGLACGLAGSGALLSLLITGPHDLDQLARRSLAPGLDLASFVRALGIIS